MKRNILLIIVLLVIFPKTFGFNINIESKTDLGKFYIGKVEKGVFNEFDIKKYNENIKFSIFGEGYYIDNNYLLGDNFELLGKIKQKVFQKVGFRNSFDMNKGDVVIFEQKFVNSINDLNYTKKQLGENIVVSKPVDDNLIFQKTFKIKCFENKFYTYDSLIFPFIGWKDEKNITNSYHENIGLEKNNIQIKLKNTFKTCLNFNRIFNVKTDKILNYKYRNNYKLKLNKYKISLNKGFGKVLSKITGDKLTKLFNKIEEVRKEKNNDKNLIQEEKDNINILLDALIEILK